MNKVYNVDCMGFMKNIPDNYYDLLITDPDYGIYKDSEVTGFAKNRIDNGTKTLGGRPSKECFQELFRISKNQIIWGMQYFASDLQDFSQPIIWDKKTGNNYFADAELAYCSIKGTARIFRHQWCGAFKDSERKIKPIHPTQKPIVLYEWLLQKYAKKGDKIFDAFAGSGSLRIACDNLGFEFEGCEINYDYWLKQEERFKNHCLQLDLFSHEDFGHKENKFLGNY